MTTRNKDETELTITVSDIEKFAKKSGKRPGGGSVRLGIMSFKEIADVIVPCEHGFDKKSGMEYDNKSFVLSRIFKERGWPPFNKAIVLAGMRKYVVDPKDGFVPYAPGTIDIEAAIELNTEYRELRMEIDPRAETEGIHKLHGLKSKIGFSTEYGNGPDSLETDFLLEEPGIWKKINDIQFNRPTGIVIVTPYITLWCEDMSINNLIEMPNYMTSVKMLEAIKIVKNLREINNII